MNIVPTVRELAPATGQGTVVQTQVVLLCPRKFSVHAKMVGRNNNKIAKFILSKIYNSILIIR